MKSAFVVCVSYRQESKKFCFNLEIICILQKREPLDN